MPWCWPFRRPRPKPCWPHAQRVLHWPKKISKVTVAPCWTLMLAFPQAMQPDMWTLGPQWNAARSTHHRMAWLARESSKPGRGPIERWTVQASAAWSQEHLKDDPKRVQAKLIKAFAEITGIRAEPAHVDTQRWLYAKTDHAAGQEPPVGCQGGLGRVRRLVPGPPGGRRVCVGSGTGLGHRLKGRGG